MREETEEFCAVIARAIPNNRRPFRMNTTETRTPTEGRFLTQNCAGCLTSNFADRRMTRQADSA